MTTECVPIPCLLSVCVALSLLFTMAKADHSRIGPLVAGSLLVIGFLVFFQASDWPAWLWD